MRDAEGRLAAARVPKVSRIGNFPLIFDRRGGRSQNERADQLRAGTGTAGRPGLPGQRHCPDPLAQFVVQQQYHRRSRGKLFEDRALWSRAIRRSRAGARHRGRNGRAGTARGGGVLRRRAPHPTRRCRRPPPRERPQPPRPADGDLAAPASTFRYMSCSPAWTGYPTSAVRSQSQRGRTQVVGATLPLSPPHAAGIYGEQQAATVGRRSTTSSERCAIRAVNCWRAKVMPGLARDL